MANGRGMVPFNFQVTSSGASITDIGFTGGTRGAESVWQRIKSVDLSGQAHMQAITLPNGSVYWPSQTYTSPKRLGDFRFTVVYARNTTDYDSDIWLEAIQKDLWNALGLRGNLQAKDPTSGIVTVSADAIFAAFRTGWAGRKYDWNLLEGLKLQTLEVDFTFTLLADWA